MAQKVRFLLIGGHAMAAHGAPRFTGDLDVWVQPGKRNAERVMKVLVAFGFGSVKGLSDADFTSPGTVVALGHPPMRIDLLTSVSGVTFERAWRRRRAAILGGVPLSVIGVEDLIANKRAAARPKDLVDVATLEALSATRRRG
ncbi:MAG: nucleotidyltransferase [Myxococcales bacterium]|nr:nucleotidyltransferase [Myxococcales bacterium]